MARTIKEMAEEYAATGEFLENGKEMIDFQAEKSYRAGANAVLSEIERIINENEDGCLALERIQLSIDDLKG